MPLYLGEAAGARVIQVGIGPTDVTASDTTPVLLDATTHDLYPAGPGASIMFRGIVLTVRHDVGYHLGVTPIVDGVSLAEQSFQSPAPSGGLTVVVKAPFVARGIRCAARVRQTAADGMLELVDVAAQWYVVRTAP